MGCIYWVDCWVASVVAGIAPARNAKRAGDDGLRVKAMSAERHAAAQYATSGRHGPAWYGMRIAWIVVDDTCVGRLSVGCRFCNFDRRDT